MATRAVIIVPGMSVKLYKHWDGYPERTLPWLEKFNKEFTQARGVDPNYKFAQLIRSSVRMAEEFDLDISHHTGWGVMPINENCGEEYIYTLQDDGTVTYKCMYDTRRED